MKVEDIKNGVSSPPFTNSASDLDGMGQNYKQMGIGFSNQKKEATKGYASPTISASAKAIDRSEKSDSINKKTQMKTGPGLDSNEDLGIRQSGSLLSTEQYDPLTNYLSPRPKFLRYRPNRSREILLRQRNEVEEEIYDEQKVLFSPGSSSEEFSENEEEEDAEEEDELEEEDEEFEEDRRWSLKGVLKFLALIMAAVLYATHLPSLDVDSSSSSHSFWTNEVLSNGTCSLRDFKKDAELRARDFIDPTHGRRQGWMEEVNVNNFSRVEAIYGGFNDQTAEGAEMKDEVGELEFKKKGGEDDSIEGEELEFEDPFNYKESEETKIFQNAVDETAETKIFKNAIESNDESAETKIFENAIESNDEIIAMPEKMADSNSNFFNSIRSLTERNYSENKIIQSMNTQLFFQILASFSAFLIVLIVSAVFYRSKKKIVVEKQQFQRGKALELKNENTLERTSPLMLKACAESVIVEENDSIISREGGQPLASIWLKEEKDISNERYYNSRSPIVELLGEFVIGGEIENTPKNRMIESKDSNNLVSIEERLAYSRPPLSELSNSPSYGSFTAEKPVKNKVPGGQDSKVNSTPVRRSSRIKNRAAKSP